MRVICGIASPKSNSSPPRASYRSKYSNAIFCANRTCLICRMEELMLKYEVLLFNIGDQDTQKDATSTEPNWKHTALECALHGKFHCSTLKFLVTTISTCFSLVLLTCSRTTMGTTIDNTSAGHQLKALSLLKREFKSIRAIWTKQCDLLHVFDEIRMAKSTLDPQAAESDLFQPGTSVFEVQKRTKQK